MQHLAVVMSAVKVASTLDKVVGDLLIDCLTNLLGKKTDS